MEPNLWFVTPVHQRVALTEICLEQRRRMLDALPFEAHAVVIGDDGNMSVAKSLGFDLVPHVNDYVGKKFNAGYQYAKANGATHCMAIGSDSWLHPSALDGAVWDDKAIGLIGLSSFAPLGDERIDLGVKYPAGFGVGMVYPSKKLRHDPCSPHAQFGCDSSTWSRNGRNKIGIEFLELRPHTYLNFHSGDVQITDYKGLRRSFNRTLHRETEDPLGVLHELYDEDLIERMEALYATRSLQVFFTNVRLEPPPRYRGKDGQPRKRWLPPAQARRLQERERKRLIKAHGQPPTPDRFRAIMGRDDVAR